MEQKIIPIFLDWTGTMNHITSEGEEIGAEKFKKFLESIKNLEEKTGARAVVTIISGSPVSSAQPKIKLLSTLSNNQIGYSVFIGMVAEYCGYFVNDNSGVKQLTKAPEELFSHTQELKERFISWGNGDIDTEVSTYMGILLNDNTSKEDYERYLAETRGLFSQEYDISGYFDEYGKGIDIKSIKTNKKEAVETVIRGLIEAYKPEQILAIITGGDSYQEDVPMAYSNVGGIPIIPIAPNNSDIPQEVIEKLGIIVGNGENVLGISDSINAVATRLGK